MPARYTDKIYDILQRENPDANLATIEGIKGAALHSLFTPEMLAFIDERHRDAFTAGFALHYLQDEIGYPTFSSWQIALLEKLLNNAAYINLVYDNLDKQIFSNYRVHKSDGANTSTVTTTPNLTDTSTYGSDNTTTQSGKVVTDGSTTGQSDTTSNSGKTQSTATGSASSNSTGNNTTDTSGNTTSHDTGDNTATTKNTGTVQSNNSSTDTTSTQAHTIDTSTQAGSRVTDNSGNTVTTDYGEQSNNGWNQYSDTPQNKLADVKNGTYLTNATYTEGSNQAHTDSVKNGASTVTETFNGYKTTNEHTADPLQNKTTSEHTGNDSRTDDLTSTTTGKTSNDGTVETTGKTTSNDTSTTSSTNDNTATTEQLVDATQSATQSGTTQSTTDYQNLTTKNTHGGSDVTTHTGTTQTDNTGKDNRNEESYEISMAMLLQSEPLMSKLWRLFDDLFMWIYDTYNFM